MIFSLCCGMVVSVFGLKWWCLDTPHVRHWVKPKTGCISNISQDTEGAAPALVLSVTVESLLEALPFDDGCDDEPPLRAVVEADELADTASKADSHSLPMLTSSHAQSEPLSFGLPILNPYKRAEVLFEATSSKSRDIVQSIKDTFACKPKST